MTTIEIHSPQRFVIPGGTTGNDYKRKINLESFKDTGQDMLLVFKSNVETDRFIDFMNYVSKANSMSGPYTLHFIEDNKWIQANIIEQINEISIVMKHYKKIGGFIGGDIKEI